MARIFSHSFRKDYNPHKDKLVLQCQLCSGLMIGYKCFERHLENYHTAHKSSKCWESENYRPILQVDRNSNLLAKWIDCKCEGQRKMSRCTTISEMTLAYNILKWARLTFLLVWRRRWEGILKLTNMHNFVEPESLDEVLTYLA